MISVPRWSSQLLVTPLPFVLKPTTAPSLLIPVAVVLTAPGMWIAVNTPVAWFSSYAWE